MMMANPSERPVKSLNEDYSEMSDTKCSSCNLMKYENSKEKTSWSKKHFSIPTTNLPKNDSTNEIHSIDLEEEGGIPLDQSTKEFMESRFGHDFSKVRIHTNSSAAQSARTVNALAYTVGQDIFFGEGQYQPENESGRMLIAHELAHTIQQKSFQNSGLNNLKYNDVEYHHLEKEADNAANVVAHGQSLNPMIFSQSTLRVSRSKKIELSEHKVTSLYSSKRLEEDIKMETTHKVTPDKKFPAKDEEISSFSVDNLELHKVKGPVLEDWEKAAKAKALSSYITMEDTHAKEAGLWQERANTDSLRARWLNRRGWKESDELDTAWKNAGGDDKFPKAGGGTCEMDHIIELQVGGNNTEENIQVLDRIDNGASGSLIKQQVFKLAESIATNIKKNNENPPAQIRLNFNEVKMQEPGNCNKCCEAGKKLGKPKTKEGMADKTTKNLIEYLISAGGKNTTLWIPEKTNDINILNSDVPANVGGAELIPGLLLTKLHRKDKGTDTIKAQMDDRDKTRLPISLQKSSSEVEFNVQGNRTLKLSEKSKENAGIAFTYDYLSPGKFTKMELVQGGVAGEGYIQPDKVPFLKRIDIAFSPEYFRLKAPLDKEKLKPPFSGVTITDASLAIDLAPKLKPVGTIAFDVGVARKLASGKVTVSADETGIVLDGNLQIFLPGVDNATGNVKYQGGVWSGGAHIEASKINLPYIKSGALDVFITAGRIDATGKLNLELPGKNDASLELKHSDNKWIFQGSGIFKVNNPYLKPIRANIFYDGEFLKVTGKAGFAFAGLDGIVDAVYENKKGQEKIHGKGEIKINKGKAIGSINVELLPNHKVIGKGHLSYEIKKDMVATAGITVDESQKITFDGELSFPDIQLFKQIPESRQERPIFEVSSSIPIPGASIGPIGLKVKIEGGIYYYYYVGPGVLKGIKAAVKFSPFEDNPDFNFNLKATPSIPAGGGITGKLGAKVAIDALIAEVGGGLDVSATAGLEGKAELASEIAYSKDKFSVDASAYIGGIIILVAGLNARVYAEAGVWRFKVKTEKVWELAKYNLNTGLQLGIRVPLHYDSIEGFRIPSLSDIKPEPPKLNIDPSNLLSNLFHNARNEEHEK